MFRKYRNKNGITLIEMVIALAFIVTITLFVFSGFLFGSQSFFSQTAQVDSQSQVRTALREITVDIRKSEGDVVYEGNVLAIGETIYSLDNNELKRNGKTVAVRINSMHIEVDNTEITVSITGTDGLTLATGVEVR